MRMRLVTHHRGALSAQLHRALHDGLVVIFVVVVTAHCVAFEQRAAQLTIG